MVVVRLWNLESEKLLSFENSVKYSVGAWKIIMLKTMQNMEAWLVKVSKGNLETLKKKDLFIYLMYMSTLLLSSDTPEEGIGSHHRWS